MKILWALAAVAEADLPVHAYLADVASSWVFFFSESSRELQNCAGSQPNRNVVNLQLQVGTCEVSDAAIGIVVKN